MSDKIDYIKFVLNQFWFQICLIIFLYYLYYLFIQEIKPYLFQKLSALEKKINNQKKIILIPEKTKTFFIDKITNIIKENESIKFFVNPLYENSTKENIYKFILDSFSSKNICISTDFDERLADKKKFEKMFDVYNRVASFINDLTNKKEHEANNIIIITNSLVIKIFLHNLMKTTKEPENVDKIWIIEKNENSNYKIY